MKETRRIKNVVKLLLLAIAVGIMAFALPGTLAERIDEESNEFSREEVYELKSELIERVESIWELDETEFTSDSWSSLSATAEEAGELLTEIGTRLADLETFQLKIEILVDLEGLAGSFNHEFLNLEVYYEELLEELEAIEEALEAEYNALERVEETDEPSEEALEEMPEGETEAEAEEESNEEAYESVNEEVNINRSSCYTIPRGMTHDITTSGNNPAINVECLIIEEDAELIVNASSLTTANAIQAETIEVEDSATITINNRSGAGHGIDAQDLTTGSSVRITMNRSGSGHGLNVENTIEIGPNSRVDITRTSGGTAAAGAVGQGGGTVANRAFTNATAGIYTNTLIIERDAQVNIRTTGDGNGISVQNLELRRGSQPVNRTSDVAACDQGIITTTLNVDAVAGAGAGVRIRGTVVTAGIAETAINIGENARMCVESTATTAMGTNPDDSAGDFRRSHGIFGVLGSFNMASNSTMTLEASAIPFRTISHRSNYTMTGGAVKTVHARRVNVATEALPESRPAMVFAHTYETGAGAAPTTNRNNAQHHVNLRGSGTELNVVGSPNLNNLGDANGRGNMILIGDNSSFTVTDHATLSNQSNRTTAMLFFGENISFNITNGGLLDIEVRGSAGTTSTPSIDVGTPASIGSAAAIRWVEVGSSRFNIDGGEVSIVATEASRAPLLRAVRGRNQFIVSNGGILFMEHRGVREGAQTQPVGIDFGAGTSTLENADLFRVTGYRTEVNISTNDIAISGSDCEDIGLTQDMRRAMWGATSAAVGGVAYPVTCNHTNFYPRGQNNTSGTADSRNAGRRADNSITRVEVEPGAIFEVSGNTAGDMGVFNAGQLQIIFDAPLYLNVENRHEDNGLVFNTAGLTYGTAAVPLVPVANRSFFDARNTDLAVWRNTRARAQDPISGDAAIFFHNIGFRINSSVPGFAHADLTHADGTAWVGFREWFNGIDGTPNGRPDWSGTNSPLLGTGAGVNNGWRQIRRLNANNANPIVDVLRTPTDADQRIFGHVTVPSGNRSARSAFTNEVFVDLIIRNTNGDFVQRINNVPTGHHEIFNEAAHYGVFEAEIDFSVGFEEGTSFLPAGYTVEVVRARRTSVDVVQDPRTEGTNIETQGNITSYRPTRPNDSSRLSDIRTGVERVRDVTPPSQVAEVTGMISGNLRFNGAVTPLTTHIIGTSDEPGAIVRVGRVTPGSGNVTSVEWLSGTATVNPAGEWEFAIPSDVTLTVGERLSVYISDGEGLTGSSNLGELIPNPIAPDVVYFPHLASEETIERLSNRWRVANITLPRTTITQPWAGATIGNINYHYAQATEFHDAVGVNAFDHAYILPVEQAIDSDFEFIKVCPEGYPIQGAEFRLYRRAANGIDWNEIATVTSGATGIVGFELSHGGEYRLREHAPAPGFVALPANHYWVITVNNAGVVSDPVPGNADTPEFYGTLEDEDLALENEHIYREDFEFIKESSLTGLPLAGAQFRLYRRAANGTDWTFITDELESAAVTGIVSFEHLRFGGEYRLIETVAPTNYNLPPAGHYWIINVNINDGSISLPISHGGAPAFTERAGDFFLPNIRSTVDLFEFIKTEDDGETPLPGAEFSLYRWDVVEEEWVEVRNDLVSALVTGAVRLENFLTYGSEYRLVETFAPEGFVLPPAGHHWLITVDSEGNIATPTHHGDAPEFNDEGVLSVPNNREGVPFSFTKTNDYLYVDMNHANFRRLGGARFVLSRYIGDGEWEYIEEEYSSTEQADLGLVVFTHQLTPTGIYRLDEDRPPSGFRPPLGHWVITWNETDERFVIEADGVMSLIPAFREVEREGHIYLYVGNFPEMSLPSTGGLGAMSLTIIGGLALTFVVLIYVRGKLVDDIENLKDQVA